MARPSWLQLLRDARYGLLGLAASALVVFSPELVPWVVSAAALPWLGLLALAAAAAWVLGPARSIRSRRQEAVVGGFWTEDAVASRSEWAMGRGPGGDGDGPSPMQDRMYWVGLALLYLLGATVILLIGGLRPLLPMVLRLVWQSAIVGGFVWAFAWRRDWVRKAAWVSYGALAVVPTALLAR